MRSLFYNGCLPAMLVSFCAFAPAPHACGGIVDTFSSPSPFAGLTHLTFDNAAPAGTAVGAASISASNVTLTNALGGNIFHVDPAYTDTSGQLGMGVSNSLLNADGTDFVASPGGNDLIISSEIEIDFTGAPPTTAVGLDIGSLLMGSPNMEITLSFSDVMGGFPAPGSISAADVSSGFAFRGFTFDTPIDSMSIALTESAVGEATPTVVNALGIDNLFFGAAANVNPVPAPGAATLGLIGLSAVACLRRRFA